MAYLFVNSGHNSANGNTITYSPAAGNILIVGSNTSSGAGNPTASIADNGSGSVWTTGYATSADQPSDYVSFFYCVAGTGVTVITITYNGGTPGTVLAGLVEYSGLSPTPWEGISPFNYQAAAGTGTNAVTTNNVNVTAQPAALLGWFWELGGNGGGTAGTSPIAFTRRLNIGGIMTEDARVTATGNILATCTNSNAGSDAMLSYAIALSEPGVGPPPIAPYGPMPKQIYIMP